MPKGLLGRPISRETRMARRDCVVPALLLGFVLLPGGAFAERPSPSGQLAIAIAASDTDAFIDEWVSTQATHAPVIHLVHEIARDKPLYVAFIVSGHLHDPSGRAQVDVDWVVRRPDGKVDHAEQSYAKLRGRACFGHGFVMADPALTYGFEPTDPTGAWRIEATAHDR